MENQLFTKAVKKRKIKLESDKKVKIEDEEFLSASSSDEVNRIKKPRHIDLADRLCGLTDSIRARVSHSFIPSFNVGLEPQHHFQNFPELRFRAPQPIYVANRFPDATDICYRRTINYEHQKHLLRGGRTYYLKSKKSEELAKEDIYSNHLFNFAERFNNCPDTYFNGFYDYYYSGGNLSVLPSSSCDNLVAHASGANLNNLNVSEYNKKRKLRILHSDTQHTEDGEGVDNEIFELRSFPSQNSTNPMFIMRNRNELKLLSFERYEDEDADEEHIIDDNVRFSAKVPFISFSHIPGQEHLLLTSNMRQQVRQYALDEGGPRMLQLYNLNRDQDSQQFVNSWNILRPYNEHNCFYANGRQLLLMDLRATAREWLAVKCRDTHNIFPCDRITSISVSQNEPLLYVGTYHYLHCLDIRKMSADLSDTASSVCCLTHQMSYPPCFMDTFRHDMCEYVAMSSAVAGEVRICEFKCGNIYASDCLPYQPPTLKEALHHANLAGRCLQAGADLPKRLKCCTTGLAFYVSNKQKSHNDEENDEPLAQLLMSNSNGDVFAHHVFERKNCHAMEEQRVDKQSDEIMHEFAQEICTNVAPLLQYSDICNVNGLSRVFRCKNLKEPIENNEEMKEKPVKRRLGRWQKSVGALKNYKDALAQDILAVWDVETDNECDLVMSQLPKEMKKKPKSDTLVDNWLNLGTIITPPMTVIPGSMDQHAGEQSQEIKLENTPENLLGQIINMDTFNVQEAQIVFQANDCTQVEVLPQTTSNFVTSTQEINGVNETLLNETITTIGNTTQGSQAPKAKPKIRKYVKGF